MHFASWTFRVPNILVPILDLLRCPDPSLSRLFVFEKAENDFIQRLLARRCFAKDRLAARVDGFLRLCWGS